MPAMLTASGERVRVATLLGHAQVPMAVRCLSSLLRLSAERLSLAIHDDGTLGESDRERLRAALRDPEFIARAEADARVEALLDRHPRTLRFRQENPLALKLIDGPLLEPGPVYRYCDSDVLFLRPFWGLFEMPADLDAVFMADSQNAYALRSWQLLGDRRLRLAGRVNTGLIVFRRQMFDLDRIEHVLARVRPGFAAVWLEQTCWAALAGPIRTALFHPRQIAFPRAQRERGAPVALHFISPLRSGWESWCDGESDEVLPRDPLEIGRQRGHQCGPVGLARSEARRWLRGRACSWRARLWRP